MTPLPRVDLPVLPVFTEVPLKRCSFCRVLKPATLAYFHNNKKYGFQPRCKVCNRAGMTHARMAIQNAGGHDDATSLVRPAYSSSLP